MTYRERQRAQAGKEGFTPEEMGESACFLTATSLEELLLESWL